MILAGLRSSIYPFFTAVEDSQGVFFLGSYPVLDRQSSSFGRDSRGTRLSPAAILALLNRDLEFLIYAPFKYCTVGAGTDAAVVDPRIKPN